MNKEVLLSRDRDSKYDRVTQARHECKEMNGEWEETAHMEHTYVGTDNSHEVKRSCRT